MVSPGALRLGQCPVAFICTSSLPGSWRCTYSPHGLRGDRVVAALQDQRGGLQLRQVGAVVREEGDAREVLRDLRVGAAEAVGQFRAELGTVRIPHDHGRHRARPAQVIAVQRLEQPFDVLPAEPADIASVVDVTGGRSDQDELLEAVRLLEGREHPDHRAHRVPDEDRAGEPQLAADLEHVGGIPLERSVLAPVVGGGVRLAGAHVVEEDHPVFILEGGSDEPPHVLVAAEAMREDHGLAPFGARELDVVSSQDVHKAHPNIRGAGLPSSWALRAGARRVQSEVVP